MAKYIVGAFALIIIVAGAFYWLNRGGTAAPAAPSEQTATQMATSTYATSTYSVVYPSNFTVDATYHYTGVPKKPIDGVKFTIPGSMATGTNLSADSYVSIEQLPRAKICTGDIFLLQNVKAHTVTDGGMQYSLASTTDAGAGNLYEEDVYAFPGSSPCTAVRYFIHSTEIGNYTPGTVQAFDRTALLAAFDSIRHAVTLSGPSASAAPAPSAGLANPASTNCATLGGTLEIKDESAGQVGYCHLPSGKVCEEWALFRTKACIAPPATR